MYYFLIPFETLFLISTQFNLVSVIMGGHHWYSKQCRKCISLLMDRYAITNMGEKLIFCFSKHMELHPDKNRTRIGTGQFEDEERIEKGRKRI